MVMSIPVSRTVMVAEYRYYITISKLLLNDTSTSKLTLKRERHSVSKLFRSMKINKVNRQNYIPHAFAQHAKRRRASGWPRAVVGCHFLAEYTFAFVAAMEARYLIWQVPLPWESVTKMVSILCNSLIMFKLYLFLKLTSSFSRVDRSST